MISLRFLCSASPYVPSKMFVYRVQPCVRKERLLEVGAEENDDGDGYDGVVVLRFFFLLSSSVMFCARSSSSSSPLIQVARSCSSRILFSERGGACFDHLFRSSYRTKERPPPSSSARVERRRNGARERMSVSRSPSHRPKLMGSWVRRELCGR